MPQYDAGPGDWSDREWEAPDRKQKPHAKRKRVALPPWALLAILVAVVILLCVGLVLIVRAIRNKGDEGTATPAVATQPAVVPVVTRTPRPTVPDDATATVVLPTGPTSEAPVFTEIGPGATVIVQGTGGAGLNVRGEPSTQGQIVGSARDGDELAVLAGPEEADQHTWWRVRTKDGKEGWASQRYLELKTDQ